LNSTVSLTMTIVATHITEDTIFAISDGLISNGSTRIVDINQKLISFIPKYKIPHVSLGRFDYFSTYEGLDCCIGYAGNYTLISTVISQFQDIVSSKLVLYRDDSGKPTIYEMKNEGSHLSNNSYLDEFNFSNDELPEITINLLASILERVIKKCANNFSVNAMRDPSIQILLLGNSGSAASSSIQAQILESHNFQNGSAEINRYSILPWSLVCIGEKSRISTIINSIEGSNKYPRKPGQSNNQDWSYKGPHPSSIASQRNELIKEVVLKEIQKDIGGIGGQHFIANQKWNTRLEIGYGN
jgi:hypothetical protein